MRYFAVKYLEKLSHLLEVRPMEIIWSLVALTVLNYMNFSILKKKTFSKWILRNNNNNNEFSLHFALE